MSDWRSVQFGKLGRTFSGLTGKSAGDFGQGASYIPYMNIFSNGRTDPEHLGSVYVEGGERQNRVLRGDLLFTTSSETMEEVGMTSVLLEDIGEVYLNSFCFGFRLFDFETLLPEYAVYLFRSQEVRKAISILGQGSTRYNLPKTPLLARLELTLPDLGTQRTIARILGTVDGLIEQTEALIAKQQQIKQGLLQDLFTRGVDANGQLRPSQQEAPELYQQTEIGWIPQGWKCELLQSLTSRVGSGVTPRGGSDIYLSEGVLFIRSQNVTNEGLLLDDVAYISEQIHQEMSNSVLSAFDVLLNITGASIGRCCYFPNNLGQANTNQHVCCIRLHQPSEDDATYLSEYLASPVGQGLIYRSIAGGNREGLNYQQIRGFAVPWPAPSERGEVAKRIRAINGDLNAEVEMLKKYYLLKMGLMQDLLTGRVSVDQLIVRSGDQHSDVGAFSSDLRAETNHP